MRLKHEITEWRFCPNLLSTKVEVAAIRLRRVGQGNYFIQNFFKCANPGLFLFFSNTNVTQETTVGFRGFRSRIVVVERKHADHFTATQTPTLIGNILPSVTTTDPVSHPRVGEHSPAWRRTTARLELVLQRIYSINFTLRYFFKHFDWLFKFFNQWECIKNCVA